AAFLPRRVGLRPSAHLLQRRDAGEALAADREVSSERAAVRRRSLTSAGGAGRCRCGQMLLEKADQLGAVGRRREAVQIDMGGTRYHPQPLGLVGGGKQTLRLAQGGVAVVAA